MAMTQQQFDAKKGAEKVLIVASGPSARLIDEYPYKERGWKLYAVNNACKLIDYDVWIRSSDYKGSKPGSLAAYQYEFARYTSITKNYGGQRECGFSITVTAGYCALHFEKPRVIGFLGSDMNYTPAEDGSTHFYGVGYDIQNQHESDPDQMVKRHGGQHENYLYHVYMRFYQFAQKAQTSVYNFSYDFNGRLPYPFASAAEFDRK